MAGATLWTTPVVQTLAQPAFAAGSPPVEEGDCYGCLTGGGQLITGETFTVYPGTATTGTTYPATVSFGLSPICCGDGPGTSLSLTVHYTPSAPTSKGKTKPTEKHYMFKTITVECTREGDPGMPKACANVFFGTASDTEGNTLTYRMGDLGEGASSLDFATMVVRDSLNREVVNATGTLDHGNLQAGTAGPPPTVECVCP